jgi:hypothetical protein
MYDLLCVVTTVDSAAKPIVLADEVVAIRNGVLMRLPMESLEVPLLVNVKPQAISYVVYTD